ncbi:putative sulfate transporter, partial [Operophtera brumata]
MDDDGISFDKPKSVGGIMRLVKKRLPIVGWAPEYDRTAAIADLVAGITLGLTLVPQSIAYASLANLPVQYGLYSAYIGTMLYVVLGTVKEVSIGPTSLMALLTLQLCRGLPLEFVVLLTFLAGCVVLCMGLLRLESLVDNIHLISEKWAHVRIPDVVLGVVCCTVLLMLRKLKDVRVSPKRQTLQKTLWLLSIGRNAL